MKLMFNGAVISEKADVNCAVGRVEGKAEMARRELQMGRGVEY